MKMHPRTAVILSVLALACAFAFVPQTAVVDHLAGAFDTGFMLADTNGDGIADFINGKVVVPAKPTAAENAAAANIAARLGYGTTGLTLPLVVSSATASGDGPRIWVGKDAVPASAAGDLPALEKQEGGVFAVGGNIAVVGADAEGLLAAAEVWSARAPYQWRVPGEKISAIAESVHGELAGITYLHGKQGIHRAFLRGTIGADALNGALGKLALVHELAVIGGPNAVSSKPEAAYSAPAPPAPPADNAAAATPPRLDLATLCTSRGLFTGTPRMPLPSTLSGHLYVPAGVRGIAMANLAAR